MAVLEHVQVKENMESKTVRENGKGKGQTAELQMMSSRRRIKSLKKRRRGV
jgi:hypothetical protein